MGIDVTNHPMLRCLDSETRGILAGIFDVRSVSKDEVLIQSGSYERDLYLILRGNYEIFVHRDGHRYPVATLGDGDVVGEMAFFDIEVPRAADVISTGSGTVASLDLAEYIELCAHADPAAEALEKAVLQSLATRMLDTNHILEGLLDEHQSGGLLSALAQLFRRKE